MTDIGPAAGAADWHSIMEVIDVATRDIIFFSSAD
jgi:hypothetical protein